MLELISLGLRQGQHAAGGEEEKDEDSDWSRVSHLGDDP
jgi:hypothetical protein